MAEKVELLTKEKDPRTKCWKVLVPFRFRAIMEKDEVYPTGWRHRAFYGSRNSRDKKARLDPAGGIEQQVLLEQQKKQDQHHLDLQQQSMQVEQQHQELQHHDQQVKHQASAFEERLQLLEERMTQSTRVPSTSA